MVTVRSLTPWEQGWGGGSRRLVLSIIGSVLAAGSLCVLQRSTRAGLPVLAQMPKGITEPKRQLGRGMLQGSSEVGLGYDMKQGRAAQAAEDPFNHKPLLVEDPEHPGKVVLTKDAIRRRQAYREFIKRHPRIFNPPSDIRALDATQDPLPSKTHDRGAFELQNAGVKV